MTMRLLNITDPRDNLEKARLTELMRFARKNNVGEIKDGMPALVVRKILRSKNITHIAVPNRILGSPELAQREAKIGQPSSPDAKAVPTVDAADDLARQYQAQAKKPVADMGMNELRAECKERGVKMDRTDNMAKLRVKLGG